MASQQTPDVSSGRRRTSVTTPPPYCFSTECATNVYFNSSAWSTIRQSFRIALEHSTVFVCDRFLGEKMATELENELESLRNDPTFFQADEQSPCGASVAKSSRRITVDLTGPNSQVHRNIDGLVLLIYKLGCFVSSWSKITARISHYLETTQEVVTCWKNPAIPSERVLKCVYFPRRARSSGCVSGNGVNEDGGVHLRSPVQNLNVRANEDRLVAYWNDKMEATSCASKDSFTICVTLHRQP